MTRLIKTFEDDNNLDNVLAPLSMDIDEVVYIYHHDISQRRINNCTKVIDRYKRIKVSYKRVTEEEIESLIVRDTIADVSAAKYLSIVLYEVALKNDLPIIYYDGQERVIKEYRNHHVLVKHMAKLNIDDIITLGGGKVIDTMHKPVEDPESIKLIYDAVDKARGNYGVFTAFISRINSYISDYEPSRNTYHLSENIIRKILNDEQYEKCKDLGLFKIEGNDLRFKNTDIRKIFNVSGAFLENYIYHKLKESGRFDDILMSSTIEFDDRRWKYPVSCEIDCLVLKDNDLLFVSVKSNKVEKDDINEIKVHNVVFGNHQSRPVICINSDLSDKKPAIYAKAEELGVYVVDSSTFNKDELVKRFLSIFDGTYEYEKI